MNIKNKIVKITLCEKTFNMKFDMETIANLQTTLKRQKLEYRLSDIFKGVQEQDFSIIVPLLCASIRRVHTQVSEDSIKDLLTFDNIDEIVAKLVELIDASLPSADAETKKN